jgi:DNA-binding transcriptional LysR family regulator
MQRNFDAVFLGSIELFCLAAEQKSFTVASNMAGITPAAVSRSITRLEARLGVRLFVRTTRQIRLTDAGQEYYAYCRDALQQLAEAESVVSGKQASPSGVIKISMPTVFGHYRILPLLPEFKKTYPGITFDLHISNRNIDFLAERFDLAIRGRVAPESNFISRKIEDSAVVVVASKTYLETHGAPGTLEDLAHHECIQFELPSTGRHIPWIFNENGKERDILTTGSYSCSEDVLGGITLARSGAGLFQTYRYAVEDELRSGAMVEVLSAYSGRSRPFNVMYPHGKLLPSRVRVFIDYLMAALQPS